MPLLINLSFGKCLSVLEIGTECLDLPKCDLKKNITKENALNSNYGHLFYFHSIICAGFNLLPYGIAKVTDIFLC